MNLSIIIVSYKVEKDLLSCIQSIIKETKNISYEIIVVDNEGSSALQRKLKTYRKVKYLNPNKNLGYGAGNNYGANKAKGEYLLILNPDTIILDNAIEKLYRFIKNKSGVGVVAPLLLDANKRIFPLQGSSTLTPKKALFSLTFLSKLFKNNGIEKEYWLKDWDRTKTGEVDVVPGTALMIKSNLYRKINGFDEKFFVYFEESDLCKRVKELGYKNYILSSSKIIHKWEVSMKQVGSRNKIFEKSRFYYFRKHYGFFSALLVDFFSRVGKNFTLGLIISIFFVFASLYKISESMRFIGDQAWFYLSARDIIISNVIPVAGITASHTWLHQGPWWTYLLSIFLLIFNFNPLSGVYLSVLINLATIYAIYAFTKKVFNQSSGLIAALLYATSPLVVLFTRMPYHTTPIPLLTILLMYSIYNWIKGSRNHFPLIWLYFALLYNFELATVSLFFVFLVVFIYGLIKKTKWFIQVINKAILLFSLLLFIIPMIPIFYYDVFNKFSQTLKFAGWIGYKIISSVLVFSNSISSSASETSDIIIFLFSAYNKLIFSQSKIIALIILISALTYMVYLLSKKRREIGIVLIALWLAVGSGGIMALNTPSDAYLPIMYPVFIIVTAIMFEKAFSIKRFKYIFFIIFVILIGLNIRYLFNSREFLNQDLKKKIEITNLLIEDSKGRKFNVIGKGTGSEFESFTMPYEYLLWYSKFPVSNAPQRLKYFITETNGKIIIEK